MSHSNDDLLKLPRRVVIHIGFHKTGTTTTQEVFRSNAKRLEPEVRIILRSDMSYAIWAARRAGASSLHRGMFRYLFRKLFKRVLRSGGGPADPRPVLVSCETLAGVMPGLHDKWSYAAAPLLAADALEAVHQVYGENVSATIVCTVRSPETWTHSSWQHLRNKGKTQLDLAAHTAMLGGQLDTVAWAQRVENAVAPTPVRVLALEEMTKLPLFAAGPMLDLAGVDSAVISSLSAVNAQNVGKPC